MKIQFIKFTKGIWLFLRYGPAKVSEWQTQATRDPLTGLYNKRFIGEVGRKELARLFRLAYKGISYPFSILRIDVDHFKAVNDTEGHREGDETLRRVARFLLGACRESDIIGRTGGDEFTILLPQTSEKGAQELVSKLKKEAEGKLFTPGGKPIELSFGVASLSPEGLEEKLEEEADRGMYQDKRSKPRD